MSRNLLVCAIMAVFVQDIHCCDEASPQASSHIFTLRNLTAFIRVTSKWPLSSSQQLKFSFRTKQPNGLLLFHGMNSTENLHLGLFLILQKGRLKVIFMADKEVAVDSFYIGEGLNNDEWQNVSLSLQPTARRLHVAIGQNEKTVSLLSLSDYSVYRSNDTSILFNTYFGGTDLNYVWNLPYSYGQFIGCIGSIMFNNSAFLLTTADFNGYSDICNGCLDLCLTETKCKHNSRCINHYTETSCDCFGTNFEGSTCEKEGLQVISLFGSSYLGYRMFDAHGFSASSVTRIGVTFKADFPNSVLLFGTGKEPSHNYFVATILKGGILFELYLGDLALNATFSGLFLGSWHNLTLLYHQKKIEVIFDQVIRVLQTDAIHQYLDTEAMLYIGGLPDTIKGSDMQNNFIGCLQGIYFNNINLLYAIQTGEPSTRYYGSHPIQHNCKVMGSVPITFPSVESQLQVKAKAAAFSQLSFEFKTKRQNTSLISGYAISSNTTGTWQIHLQNTDIILRLQINSNITLHLDTKVLLSDEKWHHISLSCHENMVKIEVDKKFALIHRYPFNVIFGKTIIFGATIQNHHKEFIGCIQDIHFDKQLMDSRVLVKTALVKNKVYLDNCQSVDPCSNGVYCEHGGHCYVENGKMLCNCTGTGYTGNTCHFSKYRRSCQELYLVGHRKSGVYKIDIDQNGPLPPGHVMCHMEKGNIVTEIDTNVVPEMIVRAPKMRDYFIDISYNDFTTAMLQYLVQMSKNCSQRIRYECFKVPLGLNAHTWLQSTNGELLKGLVSSEESYCSCGNTQSCNYYKHRCNCDSIHDGWTSDNGLLTDPKDLPIIRIYIIQPEKFPSDGEAHLSLFALRCVEEDMQLYVISFSTHESFIQLPTWKKGDISFSFRTASAQAILLYQNSLHLNHSYFHVYLINGFTLSFKFTANNNPYIINVTCRYAVNNGEWQQVWIEYNVHHIRFTVNQDSAMVDLAENEYIGPFEGPLYIGGLPKYQLETSQLQEGFIGCFRGLIINNEVINFYEHLNSRIHGIYQGCSASCSSNPCLNGAKCLELWGTFECQCLNPVAHSGKFCEININKNALTFLDSYSFSYYIKQGIEYHPVLNESIVLSFHTYQEQALLLYAIDHFNNFVQLHWDKGKRVVFTFNSKHDIIQDHIEVPVFSRKKPIQVQVLRSKNESILISSGRSKIIDFPIKLLEKYYENPWSKNTGLEYAKALQKSLPVAPHIEIFLGGMDEKTLSNITGLVGCLQGLKIGDQHYDLQSYFQASVNGSFHVGCQMSCQSNSCSNGGLCIELWKENKTKCDCSLTSYVGDTCQKDIGANFDGKSQLSYALSTANTSVDFFNIKFAISTRRMMRPHTNQHVLHIQFDRMNYISIEVSTSGFLYIEEVLNASAKAIYTENEIEVTDGYRHWFYYSRNSFDTHVLLDGRECFVEMEGTAVETSLDNDISITVGGINANDVAFPENNFSGCLSNVIVAFKSFEAKPLEAAFGYEVWSIHHVKMTGKVVESQCAGFAGFQSGIHIATKDPSVEPADVDWKPKPPEIIPYEFKLRNEKAESLEAVKTTTAHVAIGMAVFLLIVLISLFVYIWHLQKRYKRQQSEEEATVIFKARKPHSPTKIVSFVDGENDSIEECTGLLHEISKFDDPQTKPYANHVKHNDCNYSSSKYSPNYYRIDDDYATHEMAPIRHFSSQDLEWDPAVENVQLMNTSLERSSLSGEEDDGSDQSDSKDSYYVEILSKNKGGSHFPDKPGTANISYQWHPSKNGEAFPVAPGNS